MIPVKGKKYMLNCQGPYDYNRYMGEGVFTGEVTDMEGETCYGFMIPVEKEICFFTKEEIIAEFSDDNQVRPLICDPENYPEDTESPYCEKCGSCGEDGCCTPAKCEAVKCKYGERCVEDYERMKKQWDIMFKALNDALNECGEPHTGLTLRQALKKLDESW